VSQFDELSRVGLVDFTICMTPRFAGRDAGLIDVGPSPPPELARGQLVLLRRPSSCLEFRQLGAYERQGHQLASASAAFEQPGYSAVLLVEMNR
jgi:hypothetical protein